MNVFESLDERQRNTHVTYKMEPRPLKEIPKPPKIKLEVEARKNRTAEDTAYARKLLVFFLQRNPGVTRREIKQRIPSIREADMNRCQKEGLIYGRLPDGKRSGCTPWVYFAAE